MAKKKKAKKKSIKLSRKKKPNKKSKRKSPKTTRKPPKIKLTPQQILLAKIHRIKERVPYIEPTGECKDPETDEVLFRFTEAQHVFDVYREQCNMERLHWRPYADASIQPKAIAVGILPMLIATFCIEDLDTGARLVGWGSGMGANRDWSGNTAGTRALKQFLLTTFEATWQDPEQLNRNEQKEALREEVIRELEVDGTLSRIEQIKFWAQTLGQKGKPDANIKGQDTKDSGRAGSKKTRTRKKRDNRRSK